MHGLASGRKSEWVFEVIVIKSSQNHRLAFSGFRDVSFLTGKQSLIITCVSTFFVKDGIVETSVHLAWSE